MEEWNSKTLKNLIYESHVNCNKISTNTFKPDDCLRGTLEKIPSAKASVSPEDGKEKSITNLLTTSAGDVACLAAIEWST